MTRPIFDLGEMMAGGLTLPSDALCSEQWALVGYVRRSFFGGIHG